MPVEIVLNTGLQEPQAEFVTLSETRLAGPLGRRFVAGVLDFFILLVALALFALVFWGSGGRLTLHPLDLGIVASAAAFFLLLYFALFTALAFATPGQSAMALRVRTMDDGTPDPAAAMWRAFGYLVSAAALMLGFVWAALDSDRLTWHDRMSGTCLAEGRAGDEA